MVGHVILSLITSIIGAAVAALYGGHVFTILIVYWFSGVLSLVGFVSVAAAQA